MFVILTRTQGRVILTASAGGLGQTKATLVDEIGPGWKRWGKTYEEWLALPWGKYEIPDDYDRNDDYAPPELRIPV